MTRTASPGSVAHTLIEQRCGGRCEICGRVRPVNFAHRRHRGMGGGPDALWALANGVAACGSGTTGCHGWCHDHPLLAHAGGWVLRDGQDPESTPVWLRTQHHWLGDNGAAWWLLRGDLMEWIDPVTAGLPDRPVLPEWAA